MNKTIIFLLFIALIGTVAAQEEKPIDFEETPAEPQQPEEPVEERPVEPQTPVETPAQPEEPVDEKPVEPSQPEEPVDETPAQPEQPETPVEEQPIEQPTVEIKKNFDVQKIKDFIISKLSIDFESCFSHAAGFAHEIKSLVAAVQSNPLSIESVLNASYNTAETFNPLLHSCDIQINLINKIDAFTFSNPNTCFSNINTLVNTTQSVVTLIKNKNIDDLILILQGVQSIVYLVNNAKQNCAIVPKPTTALLGEGLLQMNFMKCFSDAKTDYNGANELITIIQNKNSTVPIEDVFELSINLYNNIVSTFQNCFDNSNLPIISNVVQLKACVKDIRQITTDVVQAYTDIKSFQFKALYQTLKNVYSNVRTINDTCTIKKASFLSQ